MWFPAGKVRGEFKEIVHTIATVQTIDVSKLSLILYSVDTQSFVMVRL